MSVYNPAIRPVPNYTAWRQRHIGVNNLPKVTTQRSPGRLKPTSHWSQIWCLTSEPPYDLKAMVNAKKSELATTPQFILRMRLTFCFAQWTSILNKPETTWRCLINLVIPCRYSSYKNTTNHKKYCNNHQHIFTALTMKLCIILIAINYTVNVLYHFHIMLSFLLRIATDMNHMIKFINKYFTTATTNECVFPSHSDTFPRALSLAIIFFSHHTQYWLLRYFNEYLSHSWHTTNITSMLFNSHLFFMP